MSELLTVQSHRGPYSVAFDDDGLARVCAEPPPGAHFLVDEKVERLHPAALAGLARATSVLRLEATEENKSLHRIEGYVEALLEHNVRRADVLVAIGGGIIQDITCFLASTLLRGVPWHFYPTTLLAQADSCIGSKSSINVGKRKNLMGTFYPPAAITVGAPVLSTLDERDVRSGVGEMLKVHAIDGPASFDRIAADYRRLLQDATTMQRYVRRSLEVKRRLIEEDEFDRGPRNVMNYGHSFGHAIESATNFAVPHGIGVTVGMDMANFVAVRLGLSTDAHHARMHPVLAANYAGFERVQVPTDALFDALGKDKKNTARALRLVLPDAEGRIGLVSCKDDAGLRGACAEYLETGRVPA